MITTERLFIRPAAKEDARFFFVLMNTKEWINNIGQRNITDLQVAEQYIQDKMMDHYTENGYGNYVMIDQKSGETVGCVSLYNRPDIEDIDLGFALLPTHMKKGYAHEGALAIMKVAKEVGLKTICAFTTHENVDSQRLIEKLGFTKNGTIFFGEEKEELLNYTLTF